MNWYSIKNRIKYNWKRVLAIFFASIGTAIELTLLIVYLFLDSSEDVSFLSIISYVIVLIAYYYLLAGNIRGTMLAYRGFMLFIFFNFIDFAEILLFNLIGSGGIFLSGNLLSVSFTIVALGFMALGFVSGLMTYINFRRYGMVGYRTTYEKIRDWCLVFTICMVISYGSSLVLDIILSSGISDPIGLLLTYLEPIGLICMSLCSFITILRLKD